MIDKSYDIAIVGGGIIGLATAMELTATYPHKKIAVLEKESEVACHQTGHNSGVIHAGIYYAPGSQKANFCSTGGTLLREFCDKHGIEYDMCGKLIVASDESEIPGLEELYRRGIENGAEGLRVVDKDEMHEIEPHVAGVKAIFSPNTGIIDYQKVSIAYATEFSENSGDLITDCELRAIVKKDQLIYLETNLGTIKTEFLINCAGLQADKVAKLMDVETGIRIVPFRGEYFSIIPERSNLVNGLIYPVPNSNLPFLGVHFTKRINGSVEAGPNAVFAFAREGYSKTSFNIKDTMGTLSFLGFWRMSAKYWKVGINEQYRSLVKGAFVKSLQKLIPEVSSKDLSEPGAGVRAQAVNKRGELLQDFSIVETNNSIHVLSAPSPGATSSLTISKYLSDMAKESFSLE